MCKKDYAWNPATCNFENCIYLAIIINDSVITCDEIKGTTKTVSTKTFPTTTLSTKSNSINFYIFLTFLLITLTLLRVAGIYC